MSTILTTAFLAAAIRLTVTIAIAALGEVIVERSGVFNVGIEGLMLIGAFFAVWGSDLLGSAGLGAVFAAIVGMVAGIAIGYLAVTLRLDQIVVGIIFTIFALGLTSFLNDIVFAGRSSGAHEMFPVAIPLLSDIPVVGRALFRQVPLTYVGYVLVGVFAWGLYRSRAGLLVRASGENPAAVAFAGHDVARIRYLALCVGGATAGLAGALISLSSGGIFVDNMTGGRGWIALIAVMLGRWRPGLTVAACALFGIGDALQFRLQAINSDLPLELFFALPYLLTLAVLLGVGGHVRQPTALGVPYERS
ncbi:MAG: ral nucleoside transport system permease protein [Solirubrobacteraceae bacterium]|nr:ral nucleoside transport system permease protein [Solirubrobacteraceae bacterium]